MYGLPQFLQANMGQYKEIVQKDLLETYLNISVNIRPGMNQILDIMWVFMFDSGAAEISVFLGYCTTSLSD